MKRSAALRLRPDNPPRGDGMVRAELVALETAAADLAVVRVHVPVPFLKYPHRAHVDADTTHGAAVGVDVHFNLDGCRQADFHDVAHGPGRNPAAGWALPGGPR